MKISSSSRYRRGSPYITRCLLGTLLLGASCSLLLETPVQEPTPPPSLSELLGRCTYEDGQRPDSPSCFEAGRLLIKKGQQPEAERPLQYACLDIPDACVELGLLHLRGEGLPRDTTKASKAFATAGARGGVAFAHLLLLDLERPNIDAGDRDSRDSTGHLSCERATVGWPCTNYGVLLSCGYFGPIDLRVALSAFHRGCFLNDPRACDLASKLQTGTTSLPCDLVGPDPNNPIELNLNLDPPDPSETWPEGHERFRRRYFEVLR